MKVKIGPYLKAEEVEGGKERKIKIKIHKYDVWSLDHTLSKIILPCLRTFQEAKSGSPLIAEADLPVNVWDKDIHKRWDWVIEEMIFAFEKIAEDDDHLWKINEMERIDNGLFLFGKYFRDLWT